MTRFAPPISESELPRAMLEALAASASADPADIRKAQRVVAGLDQRLALDPLASQRLTDSVAELPVRYAPFYSRLARLFDMDEAEVEQRVAQLAPAGAWRRTGLRGIRRASVSAGPLLGAASVSFVRFARGAHFPHHRHLAFEQVFILQGSYVDDAGNQHGPGDLHEMQAGSVHEFWVDEREPCIAASVHRGLRFTRWPTRLYNPFLDH